MPATCRGYGSKLIQLNSRYAHVPFENSKRDTGTQGYKDMGMEGITRHYSELAPDPLKALTHTCGRTTISAANGRWIVSPR
jgi:hypothetical protein